MVCWGNRPTGRSFDSAFLRENNMSAACCLLGILICIFRWASISARLCGITWTILLLYIRIESGNLECTDLD